jgi:endonuclease YncB( thermonuclease family)
MAIRFVNLTPHALVIRLDRVDHVIPPSGGVARVTTTDTVVAHVEGIPVTFTTFGRVEGIPAPEKNVIYLASLLAAQEARRGDVLAPDTGPTAIREDGKVVAVRGLRSFA